MKLYDGKSEIIWASGPMTVEEMREVPSLEQLLSQPSVLLDNDDFVVDWMLLSAMCAKYEVVQSGDAETDFAALVETMNTPKKEESSTDPQFQTIARLAVSSIDFAEVSATDVVAIPDYIPEWSTLIGQQLKHNSPCRYNGTIYRASQDVTVQDIYPPDVAGESQYYPIEVAPDGIIVYRTCHGAYDMVRAGEKRHYPDAEGPVYRAKVDTAYSPDTYPDDWTHE